MDTELMEFLNEYTDYNFGYVATNLYVSKEGKLESVFNHYTEEQGVGLRQRTVLYGIENSRSNSVTTTITIVENNGNYDLLELGVLKLEQVTEDEIKKHMLYKDYVNQKDDTLTTQEELPAYDGLLKEKKYKIKG